MPASAMNPGAKVRIQGLRSRGDLNGKEATVRNATMNGRFVVLVQGTGEQISLKPGNMQLLAAAPPAGGGGGGASGSPFSAERIAEIQRQVQQFVSQIQSMVPPGTNPTIVLGAGAVLLGLFAFTFGLMTTALLVSVLVFAARHGADSFRAAGGGKEGAKAAANAIGAKVSSKVRSVTGFNLSPMQALGLVAVILLLVLRITSSVGSGGVASPKQRGQGNSFDPFSSTVGVDDELEEEDPLIFDSGPTYEWKDMELAYKAGYDDAIDNEKSFQESLTGLKKKQEETRQKKKKKKKKRQRRRPAMDDYDDMPPPSSYGSGSSGGGGGFGIMKIFTLGIIGKTVYDLGNGPAGWNQQTFLMNLQAMPKWRLALNAFLVLRLIGMSPI